jgi:hypothetical protein
MAKQKHNWQKIEQEYIAGNLASGDKGPSLKELAERHSISKNVLWNKSCAGDWVKKLDQAVKEKNDELSKQVVTAAVEIDKGLLMEEYRVRVENYNVSTKMMEKLINRWNSLTDEDLLKMSPLDVVKGVHVCLKAREQAAGLPRVFVLEDKLDNNGPPGEMPAAEGALSETKVAKMTKSLSIYLEKNNDEDAIDV